MKRLKVLKFQVLFLYSIILEKWFLLEILSNFQRLFFMSFQGRQIGRDLFMKELLWKVEIKSCWILNIEWLRKSMRFHLSNFIKEKSNVDQMFFWRLICPKMFVIFLRKILKGKNWSDSIWKGIWDKIRIP